jgi:hypothetical protein
MWEKTCDRLFEQDEVVSEVAVDSVVIEEE